MLKKARKNIAKCTKGQAMREWLVYSADAIVQYLLRTSAHSIAEAQLKPLVKKIETDKLATDVIADYNRLLRSAVGLTDKIAHGDDSSADTSYLTDYGSTISIRDGWLTALDNSISNMED